MDKEACVAFVNTQVACALAEIEAMKVANLECQLAGTPLRFKEQDFRDIPDRFQIGWNTVIGLFTGR